MTMIWRTQAEVHTGLVFSMAEKNLAHKGLRWAPESFLGHPSHVNRRIDAWLGSNKLSQDLNARISDDGLVVQLPGILLHPNWMR
jgi:hypothetical protein